jgi:hypothetical protein
MILSLSVSLLVGKGGIRIDRTPELDLLELSVLVNNLDINPEPEPSSYMYKPAFSRSLEWPDLVTHGSVLAEE